MGDDPTRYPLIPPERSPDPRLALTLGEMISRRWQLRAACSSCGVIVWCDPAQLSAAAGDDCFFWGRRGRRRVFVGLDRCRGQVTFQAKPLRSDTWTPLGGDQLQRARHLWRTRKRKGGAT